MRGDDLLHAITASSFQLKRLGRNFSQLVKKANERAFPITRGEIQYFVACSRMRSRRTCPRWKHHRMIAEVGAGFKGAINYILMGQPNPDRVAWVELRNLATNKPEHAARVMRATASNPRDARNPFITLCFHGERTKRSRTT